MAERALEYLSRRAEEVNGGLEILLPAETEPPQSLHRAMRYSVFAGGKRLRPALALAAGEALGGKAADILPLACAIEMIHTYSLIHDDLPAMDNDDLRRGRPTCHKAFGEAIAILAGDALLTLAFRVLASDALACGPARQLRVIREIAAAAGTVDALIGGQAVDIESEGKRVDASTLEYIHRSKTGALICAAVVAGGIAGGGDDGQVDILRRFGQNIGLAFQIADDVLDVTATSEQLGKTAGKDQAALKATYPSLYGIAGSEARARALVDEAMTAMSGLGVDSAPLLEVARFIVARRS